MGNKMQVGNSKKKKKKKERRQCESRQDRNGNAFCSWLNALYAVTGPPRFLLSGHRSDLFAEHTVLPKSGKQRGTRCIAGNENHAASGRV